MPTIMESAKLSIACVNFKENMAKDLSPRSFWFQWLRAMRNFILKNQKIQKEFFLMQDGLVTVFLNLNLHGHLLSVFSFLLSLSNINKHGVNRSVKIVAKLNPPTMEVASGLHIWLEGASYVMLLV